MPLIIPSNSISAGGYVVDNSLRFNDGSSDNLTKTSSTGSNTTSTFSGWIKRANLGAEMKILNFTGGGNNLNIEFKSDDQFSANAYDGSSQFSLKTNRKFRDPSAWYHIVVAIDSTQSTSSNRIKIYVNGVQETSFTTSNYPTQNDTLVMNNHLSSNPFIGQNGSSNHFFDGYMAEICWIDGQQLDPTSFGEFDEDSGIWKPIDVSGLTFGTNGFYLDFENSGSLGADVSGNGNNFTVNNLTSIDQTTDTPTNNFATFNSLYNITGKNISEGNCKTVTDASNTPSIPATIGMTTGKWYCEYKLQAGDGGNVRSDFGITGNPAEDVRNTDYPGQQSYSYAYNGESGNKMNGDGTTGTSYGTSMSIGDIIGVAVDLDNNYIYFSKNGTWQNSGDPESGATGTGSAYSLTTATSTPAGAYFFTCGDHSAGYGQTIEANFGNPPFTISSGNSDGNGYGNFEYSVPSGYYALNTKNLAQYG